MYDRETVEQNTAFAGRIVAAARIGLPADKSDFLDALLGIKESNLAVSQALFMAVDGLWTVPAELLSPIREWGASKTRPDYRAAVDSTLKLAGQPGLEITP